MQLINTEVRIENCSTCNAHCTICPREKMTRPKVVMPNGHFEYLVDQAKDLGAELVSVFGFGEPLIDKDIHRKIAYCTSKGLDTFITTNASLLGVEMATRLLNAGLKKIRFSFHGVHANYDNVHRGLKFDDSVRNFTNFVAKNRVRFKSQCRVAMTVIPMNGESVEEIRKYWEHGVDELEIWKPHNWGGAKDYRTVVRKKRTCGRVHRGPIQIQADGKIIPCCFLTNGEIVLGDTYKNSIEEILKGKKYEDLRILHESGLLSDLTCENCDQLNENDSPLLYSTIDSSCEINKTSSNKFKLEAA